MLELKNITASTDGKVILRDISFTFESGKTYAIFGPNGAGKSTLASIIAGHPNYSLKRGSQILFEGKRIDRLAPEKRAALGIFLSFQNPLPLPGVSASNLFRIAFEKEGAPLIVHKRALDYAFELGLTGKHLSRSMNDGFSGGEKKKLEALQVAMFTPKFLILDEVDSGADIDAIKKIGKLIKKTRSPEQTTLIITHSEKLLSILKPDVVIVMKAGIIEKVGSPLMIKEVFREGFEKK
ncbi:MAG: Fe-S cluster assembly ATPase SufC [Candidatus Moranbacteria bacterium]|jgi:Fe-S cluster assembly ATP-binding protein|nr:Fe-S cluster assembly ATPase SufC [Candidatus Moranbacteria bacterium]